MDPKLKTIGLLRFSVLSQSYYSERFDSLEEKAAHLFTPERLALRFHFFEKLCLPSLANQTDADFEAIVMTSDQMPARYQDHLRALLKPYPNIHFRAVSAGKQYPMLKEAYNSVAVEGFTHRIMFRLDDDDALDKNFIRRTKHLSRGLFHFHEDPPPTIIAYNRGFYVRKGEGENEVFDASERAPLSTGVTLVAPLSHGTNPYRFVHRRFAQHYNTYSDISVPSFIRTIHGDNKSTPTVFGLSHKMQPGHIAKELKTHFDVDISFLRTL